MSQTRYRDSQKAFAPGQDLVESFGRARTLLNADPQAKQIDEISVGASPNDNADYAIEINSVEIRVTTDSDATQDELVQALADAINDENLVNGRVVASADQGNDVVTITARHPGIGFTYTEVADPSDDLSQTRTQSNQEADPLPWGRAVEDHGSLGEKLGRLVDASKLTPRDIQLTLSGSGDGEYTVILEVDGDTLVAQYTASGDGTDTILNELQSDLDAHDLLSASVDTTASPSELHIQPETSGFADFRVTGLATPSSESFSHTIDADGDDIRERLAGVAMAGGERLIDPGVDVGQYPPNTEFDVKEDGAYIGVAVEEQPSQGDPVYVRLSANGQRDQLGAFRASWDAGCVPLPEAEWVRAPSSDVAAVEVP